MSKLKVINLLAGPGVGKSTCAAGLYYFMKMKGYRVELVREYIKNPVYEKRNLFDDQMYIFGKQHRLQHILKDDCDWIITDSPIILSAVYAPTVYFESFTKLTLEAYETYENYNFFVTRVKEYVKLGRNQSKQAAIAIDRRVRLFMEDNVLPYHVISGDMETAPKSIMEILEL